MTRYEVSFWHIPVLTGFTIYNAKISFVFRSYECAKVRKFTAKRIYLLLEILSQVFDFKKMSAST